MTRRHVLTSALGLVGLAATVVAAVAWGKPTAQRADCPGKIVCPLTGELVCKDQCPLGGQQTAESDADTAPAGSCCERTGSASRR